MCPDKVDSCFSQSSSGCGYWAVLPLPDRWCTLSLTVAQNRQLRRWSEAKLGWSRKKHRTLHPMLSIGGDFCGLQRTKVWAIEGFAISRSRWGWFLQVRQRNWVIAMQIIYKDDQSITLKSHNDKVISNKIRVYNKHYQSCTHHCHFHEKISCCTVLLYGSQLSSCCFTMTSNNWLCLMTPREFWTRSVE